MMMKTLNTTPKENALENLSNSIIENVSQELRTPLNIMMGYASLLQEGALGDLTPEQQHAMTSIVTRADDMRTLVTRLNILMEAEANLGQVETLSLSDLVRQIVEARKEDIDQAGITIQLNLDESNSLALGNAGQLKEMVFSLIDNAIKFTPRGGHITVNLSVKEEYIYLTVEDTGIGIAEDTLDHIFTSFRRVSNAKKNSPNGLGMGLTIVRAVAQKHGGDAYVKSRLGEGSRFTIKIPLASVVFTESASEVLPLKRRILIVDDDDGVAFTLQSVLERLPNCEITIATSGEKALELFSQENFDLVFTDYKMPNMNGLELTKAIRALNPSAMVILITAHSDLNSQVGAEQLNIHRYLKKPLDIKEIRQTVQDALELNQ